MAWGGIYCISIAHYQAKCGANCNATASAETMANLFAYEAESLINCVCRKTFAATIAEMTALTTARKMLLNEVASNLMAIYAIQYDMSGFTSRIEAEDMINILRDAALRGLSILRDKKVQDYIING